MFICQTVTVGISDPGLMQVRESVCTKVRCPGGEAGCTDRIFAANHLIGTSNADRQHRIFRERSRNGFKFREQNFGKCMWPRLEQLMTGIDTADR